MKKIFAIILTLAMTFALSAVALAQEIGSGTDNPGTITIDNAVIGKTYTVRKIFDATYTDNAVAYTYTKTGETDNAYNALTADASPFNLSPTGTANVYSVTKKTTATEEGILTWLNTNYTLFAVTASAAATENNLVFHVPYGYYYIDNGTSGANVIVNTVAPSITVHDKNGTPGFEGGKKSVVDGSGNVINSPTANIGDTIHFKIEANVPKYNGDTAVITYKFVDTMGEGLDYADNVNVTLKNEASATMDITEHCTITPTTTGGQSLTIEFHPNSNTDNTITGIEGYYPNAHVVITYDAKVNENATADNITNSVRMYVDNEDTTPDGDDPPGTETETYGFNLEKRKGETTEILQNAEFKLYKTRTGEGTETSPYVYSDPVKFSEVTPIPEGFNKAYRVNPDGSETIVAGKTRIWGLAAGTYYLVETKAPAGYNPLAGATTVTVGTGAGDDNIMTEPVTVKNEAGGSLPSVGGIGTTIFYIIGGLLMVGAAVLLVVRKKMSVTE